MAFRSSSALAFVLACSLAACGGGGGSPTPTPAPTNRAPTLTASSTAVTVAENSSGTLFDVSANDPDGDTVSLSLSGDDAEFFTVNSSGQVGFAAPINYDLHSDFDHDNVYLFKVVASDGKAQTNIDARVTITNEREGVGASLFYSSGIPDIIVAPRQNRDDFLMVYPDGRMFLIDRAGTRTFLRRAIRQDEVGTVLAAAANADQAYTVLAIQGLGTVARYFGIEQSLGRIDTEVLAGSIDPGTSGAMFWANNRLFAAIGNSDGTLAQEAESGFGKLYLIYYDPYCGASLHSFCFGASRRGDGIRQPVGGASYDGNALLFDRGGEYQDEISAFDPANRDLDFGWPFLEGTRELQANSSGALTSPFLTYGRGDGFREGAGIIGGTIYRGAVGSLSGTLLFADISNRIFTVSASFATDGDLHTGTEIEDRTEDFVAAGVDFGEITAMFTTSNGRSYVLNADGDIYVID